MTGHGGVGTRVVTQKQRGHDLTLHPSVPQITLEIGSLFLHVRLSLTKESILLFSSPTLRLSPREVPRSSSDSCLGFDLYQQIENICFLGSLAAASGEVKCFVALLGQGQSMIICHLRKCPVEAALPDGGNLCGSSIVSYFVHSYFVPILTNYPYWRAKCLPSEEKQYRGPGIKNRPRLGSSSLEALSSK